LFKRRRNKQCKPCRNENENEIDLQLDLSWWLVLAELRPMRLEEAAAAAWIAQHNGRKRSIYVLSSSSSPSVVCSLISLAVAVALVRKPAGMEG